jgi:hypothetical protein
MRVFFKGVIYLLRYRRGFTRVWRDTHRKLKAADGQE